MKDERDVGEATEIGPLRIDHLELPALPLCVSLVHLEQVSGKEVGLLATLSSSDLDDHVPAVIRILGQEEESKILLGRLDAFFGQCKLRAQLVPF